MTHPDPPAAPGPLVRVFTAPTASEGHLARGLLESEGIPVLLKGETEGPYRVGSIDLWVPESLEVQARMLLADVLARNRPDVDGSEPEG